MNGDKLDALARRVTARISELDGVLRVFPADPRSPLLHVVGETDGVAVHERGSRIEVEARIGTARTSNASSVIRAVHGVVRDAVGSQPQRVHVEIVVIE